MCGDYVSCVSLAKKKQTKSNIKLNQIYTVKLKSGSSRSIQKPLIVDIKIVRILLYNNLYFDFQHLQIPPAASKVYLVFLCLRMEY